MVRIYVIRHGQTEPNTRFACVGRSDVPLDDTGILQSKKLAQKLPENADIIYTSPLIRAKDTIRPYCQKHSDIPVKEIPEIIERDFGVWEDLSFKEIEAKDPIRYNEWQDNYIEYVIENGESLSEVQERVNTFLDRMCPKHENKTVFLVTHLCTARHIIARLLGLEAEKSRCFTLKNASYAVIDYDNNTKYGVIKYLNI